MPRVERVSAHGPHGHEVRYPRLITSAHAEAVQLEPTFVDDSIHVSLDRDCDPAGSMIEPAPDEHG
jgi:putative (di)nucleoside polyphosphate hydrolase